MPAATMKSVAVALLAAVCAAQHAAAQSLAQRVQGAGTGLVTLHYSSRPGVCGDGRRYFSMGDHMRFGEWRSGDQRSSCIPGPARARMRVRDGTVTELRVAVCPDVARTEQATDRGEVRGADAAASFLGRAETSGGGVAREAITAAVLADSVSVWQRILAIAADTARAEQGTRRHALFWASQFATAKVMGHGDDITEIDGPDDRDDTRGDAVFALSQMRGRRGIDPLIQIARTHRDPFVRSKAIFWIGQSGDPRAVGVLREILRG
jgi:hypothetical protein